MPVSLGRPPSLCDPSWVPTGNENSTTVRAVARGGGESGRAQRAGTRSAHQAPSAARQEAGHTQSLSVTHSPPGSPQDPGAGAQAFAAVTLDLARAPTVLSDLAQPAFLRLPRHL